MPELQTDLCTDQQVRSRLRIAAKNAALKLWPELVRVESERPEPNLIKPKALVTQGELEDFLYERMLAGVMRTRKGPA